MNELRDYRISKGLTQFQMAVLLDVSVNSIRLWEYGVIHPSKRNEEKIRIMMEGDTE